MESPQSTLSLGAWAPLIALPSHSGEVRGSKDALGKPLLIFIYLRDDAVTCTTEACGFRDAYPEFTSLGIQVMGLSAGSVESHKAFAEKNRLPFPLLADEHCKIALLLGAAQVAAPPTPENETNVALTRMTFLIDANNRIARIYRDFDPATHAFGVLRDARELLERDPPRQMHSHAPVLLIPNVLPPEFCSQLISTWEIEGNVDSGFMRQVGDKTVGMYDYGHKIRRDHFVREGPTLSRIKKYIINRVLPQMKTAFNYGVSRFEDFRIACYDASRGGFFRPHRDNTTDGTAHRRFAMSLLLNDGYEGGCLRFPEYAPHLYRPPAGAAVIFSCSLLHEATDVTAGRRFVLLSFFYGEREAKIREEYNLRTGGQYRASDARPAAAPDAEQTAPQQG